MVNLLPTDDQRSIVQSVARYMNAELPVQRLIGAARDPALTDDLWHRTAAMGWFGLSLPETAGGAELSVVEEALLFREFGRALAPPAFLAATLGAKIAAQANDMACAEAIASGNAKVALALPAERDGELFLLDSADADYILRVDEAHASLHSTQQIERGEICKSFDETVAVHRARVHGDGVVAVGPDLYHRALVLTAASLAGICSAVQDMAVEYAKIREQFGQAIGNFQAIKHRCADMAVRSEAASAQVSFAAIAMRDDRADSAFQVISAKLVASTYAITSAQENIQIHGAIGTTAELPAHLFLKRAHLLDLCFGPGREQKLRLMMCPSAQLRAA
jgi:alkylation response protein AidB-like acyl-CoA dehydrogenase